MKNVYIATKGSDERIGVTKANVVYENGENIVIVLDGAKKPYIIDKKDILELNTDKANDWFYTIAVSRYYNQAIFRENPTNHMPINMKETRLRSEIRQLQSNINQYQSSIDTSINKIKQYHKQIDVLTVELELLKTKGE